MAPLPHLLSAALALVAFMVSIPILGLVKATALFTAGLLLDVLLTLLDKKMRK